MDYRKIGNRYLVRLDPGEEILAELTAICVQEGIALGEFRGLGAAGELELGVYDVSKQQFYKETFTGPYEITSLFGTISEKDGAVYLHAHLSASTIGGASIGGHLNRAMISGTGELVIEPMEGRGGRTVNPLTGLNDLEFEA